MAPELIYPHLTNQNQNHNATAASASASAAVSMDQSFAIDTYSYGMLIWALFSPYKPYATHVLQKGPMQMMRMIADGGR